MAGAKEDEVYVVIPSPGAAGWGIEGVFFRDTLYFGTWNWNLCGAQTLSRVAASDSIREFHALTQADRSQAVGMKREVTVTGTGFRDCWTLTNTTMADQMVTLKLAATPRLVDLFAAELIQHQHASLVLHIALDDVIYESRSENVERSDLHGVVVLQRLVHEPRAQGENLGLEHLRPVA